MALDVRTIYEANTSATSANVNGGGFNPNNANFMTDLATTTGTNAAPTVTSATYTFVAGDVNNWVFVQKGTNWIPGFYKISSVAAGVATLNATIGQAVVWTTGLVASTIFAGSGSNQVGAWLPSTAQGIATQNTPGGNGTFSVDYSQVTAAIINPTNLGSVGASTTLTSASNPFTPAMVGNLIHQTTTGVGGFGLQQWFEIVTYVGVGTVTTDRTTNNGTAEVGVTGYVGGALSLGSSTATMADDDVLELLSGTNGTGSSILFVKNGAYTIGGVVSVAASGGTNTLVQWSGYATVRGDMPTGSTRPTWTLGANGMTCPPNSFIESIMFTGTGNSAAVLSASTFWRNCKITNTSQSAFNALSSTGGTGSSTGIGIEAVAYGGAGVSAVGHFQLTGSYLHDSITGVSYTSSVTTSINSLTDTIVANCFTAAVNASSSFQGILFLQNCTLYGTEAKVGIGLNAGGAGGSTIARYRVTNNIFYGFTSAVIGVTNQGSAFDDYNDYNNNTTDVSGWQKGTHDSALNPTFINAKQWTQSGTVSTATTVLTDTTATFGTLVAGQDYIYITGGGVTAGYYGIVSNTATTITVDATLGTHSGQTYSVSYGHNWSIGTNLKAAGYPGAFPQALTTGYMDVGAVQRQEAGGSGFFIQ